MCCNSHSPQKVKAISLVILQYLIIIGDEEEDAEEDLEENLEDEELFPDTSIALQHVSGKEYVLHT